MEIGQFRPTAYDQPSPRHCRINFYSRAAYGLAFPEMAQMALDVLTKNHVKAINYRVNLNGQARIATALVPANHTESVGINKWGLVVSGILLVTTLVFFSVVVLALTK